MMLFKRHLGIKCNSQYIEVIRLLSTVHPKVNAGDRGCIVCDLQTIMVIVSLTFNFICERLHHSLILPWSRFRDSATVTLTPGNSNQPTKWSHWHNRSANSPKCEKSLRCTRGTLPKTLPCVNQFTTITIHQYVL